MQSELYGWEYGTLSSVLPSSSLDRIQISATNNLSASPSLCAYIIYIIYVYNILLLCFTWPFVCVCVSVSVPLFTLPSAWAACPTCKATLVSLAPASTKHSRHGWIKCCGSPLNKSLWNGLRMKTDRQSIHVPSVKGKRPGTVIS